MLMLIGCLNLAFIIIPTAILDCPHLSYFSDFRLLAYGPIVSWKR